MAAVFGKVFMFMIREIYVIFKRKQDSII